MYSYDCLLPDSYTHLFANALVKDLCLFVIDKIRIIVCDYACCFKLHSPVIMQ